MVARLVVPTNHDAPVGTLPGPAEPTKAYVASMLDEVPVLEVVVGATVELGRTVAAQITWDGHDRDGSTWHQEVSSSPRSTSRA